MSNNGKTGFSVNPKTFTLTEMDAWKELEKRIDRIEQDAFLIKACLDGIQTNMELLVSRLR